MAKVLIEEQNLSDIAASIRSKNGTETTYKPGQMATAIEAIDTVNNQNKTVSSDGTYTADSGYTGLGEVVVSTGAAGYKQTATNWGNAIAKMSYYLAGNWGEPEPHTYTYEELQALAPQASQTVTEGITDVQTAKYKLNQIIGAIAQRGVMPYPVPQLQGDRIQKFVDAIISQVNPSTQLEAKQVTVSQSGTTTVTPTSGKYGLRSVEVTASFTPNTETKTVNISTNGTTTVNKSSNKDGMTSVEINTNVQPDLETKTVTITENGTTTITPTTGKDGMSSVEVTADVETDLTQYFGGTVREAQSFAQMHGWVSYITDLYDGETTPQGTDCSSTFLNLPNTVTKIPVLTNTNNVTSFRQCYAYAVSDSRHVTEAAFNKAISKLNTSSARELQYMFANNTVLTTLDASKITLESATNIQNMFYNCYKLAVLDISGMDFSNVTTFDNMFNQCGTRCLQSDGAYADGIPYIYVKDTAAQNWILNSANGHYNSWSTNNVVVKQ